MTDLTMILDALEFARNFFDARAQMATPGSEGAGKLYECAKGCADAIVLLKAREPRVMTLEELAAAQKTPLWKETKRAHKDLYTGWVLAYDIQKGEGITGTRLGMSEPSGRVVWYRLDDYGKTWRCWSSCPTDEQREKEPWNG